MTGATGFVGTALVERMLRCVPDVRRWCCWCATAAASSAERRVAARDPAQRLLRPPPRPSSGDDGFAEMAAERVQVVRGDVGTDGLGLDDDGPSRTGGLRRGDPLRRHRGLRLAARPGGRGEPARARPHRGDHRLGLRRGRRPCPPGHGEHLLRGRQPPRCGPRGAGRRHNPFFADIDWRAEVAAARRSRADTDAESRRPGTTGGVRAPRPARSWVLPADRSCRSAPSSSAATGCADAMVEAGRARAASVGLARRVRLHQGPRRGRAHRRSARGDAPGQHRAALDHRVGAGRAPPGLDPRLPHGRADHPVLRPRPAAGVPRRARGCRRRDPRRPRGRGDPRRRRDPARRRAHRPDIIQVATGDANPLQLPGAGRQRPRVVHRAPALRRARPADRRARLVRSRAAAGSKRQLTTATGGPAPRRSGWCRCAAGPRRAPPAGERSSRNAAWPPTGRWTYVAALRRLHRVRGRLRRRPPPGAGRRGGRRPASRRGAPSRGQRLRHADGPAVHRLGPLHHRGPPAVGGRTRPGGDHRHQAGPATAAPSGCGPRCSRPDRHLAAFDLENTLIASNVVGSYSWLARRRLGTADRVRLVAPHCSPRRPSLLAADRADRSDFLRSFYRRYEGAPVDQLDEDAAEHFSDVLLTRSFPAAIRRVREHRALGHRTVLITGALDVVIEPLRPVVRRHGLRRGSATRVARRRARCSPASSMPCPPPPRPGPGSWSTSAPPHGLDPWPSRVAYADSSSDLSMLEAVGFPVAVNPEPRLASIARNRGWLIEDFRTAEGYRTAAAAIGAPLAGRHRSRRSEGAGRTRTNLVRFGAARAGIVGAPGGRRLGRPAAPPHATSTSRSCPARTGCGSGPALSGICGSDLADGRRAVQPVVRAHRLVPVRARPRGGGRPRRTAAWWSSPCWAASPGGSIPVCAACAAGRLGNCEQPGPRLTSSPACRPASAASTGGGWSTAMVAHPSQLHEVPDELDDRAAVMIEPTACAVHGALGRGRHPDETRSR